jgi:hypothetical protein
VFPKGHAALNKLSRVEVRRMRMLSGYVLQVAHVRGGGGGGLELRRGP